MLILFIYEITVSSNVEAVSFGLLSYISVPFVAVVLELATVGIGLVYRSRFQVKTWSLATEQTTITKKTPHI